MSSDIAISVRGLSKEYVIAHEEKFTTLGEKMMARLKHPLRRPQKERFRALEGVSFDVHKGDVLGIIGRNGAGKSTLLKLLSRITEPSSGEIRLYGRVASLLEVGTGFHPELTGRENIYLNGAILGMRRAEIKKQFDAIVDFAEVEQFLDTPVKRYSSGMYVRLAFAVAAHLNPEILIVDEVLSVGDAEFQKKCLGKMQDVSKGQGRTVLFVSHNMVAVRSLCSAGVVLRNGVLYFSGSADDAVDKYMGGDSELLSRKWIRNRSVKCPNLAIKSIEIELNGDQPRMQLLVRVAVESLSAHPAALVAIDIFDQFGGWLMQAIPTITPFIQYVNVSQYLIIEIDLPPMIPGRYRVGVWVGSNLSHTIDEIREGVEFEVMTSPTPGRTVPHRSERGYLVPLSRVVSKEPSREF